MLQVCTTTLKLLTCFLIFADPYKLLSNNFLSLVRTLDEAVSGDEKLLHFTGNSGHIIAVKAKSVCFLKRKSQ